MARLKQSSQTTQLISEFSGGLNLSLAEWSIADNEAARMLNFIYSPEKLTPEVRCGTECQTASAAGASIRALYLYQKSSSVKYLIGVYGSKLYYLSGTGLDAWTEIGAIASATVVPEFITFNSKLLIADGGTKIKTWDGTTYATIDNSPNATCLRVIRQRIACNHAGEPDSIYLSAPNDETVWDTATTAIGLKAGFGDLLSVNGLEVFGDDLIISKYATGRKRMYRLNTEEVTPEYWYVREIPGNTCAQSERAILTAYNNVYFIDTDGLKSLKGVTEYGDMQGDTSGKKIAPAFLGLTCNFLKYVPYYNAIWFSIGSRIYTAKLLGDKDLAFTELYFNQGRIDSLCVDGDTVYLGGNNGYLYKLDTDSDVDETAPDTSTGYLAALRGKRYNFGTTDVTLRSTAIRLTPLSGGTITLIGIKSDGTPVTLDTITMASVGEYLNDATGYVDAATDYLYDSGSEPPLEVNRNKLKSSSIQFELQATSARFGIDAIIGEVMMTKGTY